MKITLIYKTVALLPLVGLISCVNELDVETSLIQQPTTQIEVNANPHHIELSEAIDNMYAFMDEVGFDQTRGRERGKWHVLKVKLSDLKGHTRNTNTEDTEALYVVNFEDNNGFAVLAADDRLPDNVIALSPQGHLEFTPTPVGGMGDSLTLDDLYVPEDNDYKLGELDPNAIIGGLVTNYIVDWTDGPREGEDRPLPGDNQLEPLSYSYEYETIEYIPEMLKTSWHQREPYNLHCPNKYYYKGFLDLTYSTIKEYDFNGILQWGENFIGEEDLAAGCVSIAVSQILTYNRFPSVDIFVDTEPMPWDSLTMIIPKLDTIAYNKQLHFIAELVHKVGVGCDMEYGFWEDKSFTTPAAAKRYLEKVGYTNTEKHNGYDLSIIQQQLRKGAPVFIGALGPISSKSGHAWVVDGYHKVNNVLVAKKPNGEIESRTIVNSSDYVHFNWGWGGASDGWYSTKLTGDNEFNSHNAASYDSENSNTQDPYEYTWWFRMVTYDKPNN